MQTGAPVRFAMRSAFSRDLTSSVDAYFEGIGGRQRQRDLPLMYLKSFILLSWFAGSWVLLVFVAQNAWQGALCAVSLGLSIAGIGMGVQHDANHGAFSRHAWVNRAFGSTLDLMGVSSSIWRPKHNIAHHSYTNIENVDFDLDFGVLARLSPRQTRHRWQRYQHFYLWFFYGFLLSKWVFYDDFVILKKRLIGVHKLPTLGVSGTIAFVGWKLLFIAWAIVIPALYHPLWQVLLFHLLASFTLGWTLGTVFQLAHCVGEAEFPERHEPHMKADWAEHQLETTVDFARKNAIVTWFVGGLNFQVEHHLFPKVCHLHYPKLAVIVAACAERHGLQHRAHRTMGGALASHFKHLRAMGRAPSSLAA